MEKCDSHKLFCPEMVRNNEERQSVSRKSLLRVCDFVGGTCNARGTDLNYQFIH